MTCCYILPKNNCVFNIFPKFKNEDDPHEEFISHSIKYYSNVIRAQIVRVTSSINRADGRADGRVDGNDNDYPESNRFDKTTKTFNDSSKISNATFVVNPCQYLFFKIPYHKISVSKLDASSSMLYELIETVGSCNVFDYLKHVPKINVLHVGHGDKCSVELLRFVRDSMSVSNYENNINNIFENLLELESDAYSEIETIAALKIRPEHMKHHVIFFNFDEYMFSDLQLFFKNMLRALYVILQLQTNNGTAIIKIDNLQYSVIIDILYILNTIYDKTYVIKPFASSIIETSKYIVCKHFNTTAFNAQMLMTSLKQIITCGPLLKNIVSLINVNVPQYFVNKIEEINVIIAQQQLEGISQIINLVNNKHLDDKMELFKRTNITKCIQWCEKYQVPCNKFIENQNSFVSFKNIFNGKFADVVTNSFVCVDDDDNNNIIVESDDVSK